jgi:uncharacterized membrane protein YsdA (DUF1294 family)
MIAYILLAALALNALSWACFRIDKARAGRGRRRLSERTLLLLALIGGSLGALAGMYGHRRRHKTSKPWFVAAIWTIVALQTALAVLLARSL